MTSTTGTQSYWRIAIPAVIGIVALGSLSGFLSNSGYSNDWFAALDKPGFMPPGWMFGVVWTTLYALMGLAVAMVWTAPQTPERTTALRLFVAQLAVNFAWSPIFFGARLVEIGLLVILVMFVLVALTAWRFGRIRPLAGWLLVPYLAWLCVATALNFEIGRLNPGADAMPLGLFGG
jgi:tryptophan-rich sensory protein